MRLNIQYLPLGEDWETFCISLIWTFLSFCKLKLISRRLSLAKALNRYRLLLYFEEIDRKINCLWTKIRRKSKSKARALKSLWILPIKKRRTPNNYLRPFSWRPLLSMARKSFWTVPSKKRNSLLSLPSSSNRKLLIHSLKVPIAH